MKAIFLFLLLAGCGSEDANVSHRPPAVPSIAEGIPSDDEDVSADDEATQPAPPRRDDSNVIADEEVTQPAPYRGGDSGTQSSNAYTAFTPAAPTNTQNYDAQIRSQQQDATRRLYDQQRQNHESNRRLYDQQRQNTFVNRPKW